jgi:uncharacterized protein (DUF362 family)
MGAAAAGLLVAGCRVQRLVEAPGLTPATPGTEPISTPRARVAIAQAQSYDRDLVRRRVQALLDRLGGLDDVLSSGDRVAVKVNLTGGNHFTPPLGVTATESYLTHPQVVRALGELLRDAGARELFIVEAVYDSESYRLFGYEEVAKPLAATLIDLNGFHPYSGFASAPVGEGAFIYDAFHFNPILEEIDAFVSVAKMKCHFECGVTHSMKNLIGLVPVMEYRLDGTHWWRSALHGQADEIKTRLPRVILDLNPVATDTVATAAMGFDPTVEPPAPPFLRGDNYLNLAHQLGLGTNRLEEIEVVGASIDEVLYEFEPSREM